MLLMGTKMINRVKFHKITIFFVTVALFNQNENAIAFSPSVQKGRSAIPKIFSPLCTSHTHIKPNYRHQLKEGSRGQKFKLFDSLNQNDEKGPPLSLFLEKALNTGIDNKAIQPNSLVVTKYDLPEIGIFADQTYELKSIYLQGVNSETGEIEKINLPQLDLTEETVPSGYTLYIALYSSMYHDNDKHSGQPVIVTPAEVGLISMKDEVLDSVLVAIPILSFWLGTCFVFVTKYNQRYGGNFLDALFGK